MDKNLFSHYGKALFEYSLENKNIDKTKEDIDLVNELLNANPDFRKFLSSPTISINEKYSKLKTILSSEIEESTLTFLNIMIKKNAFNNFRLIHSSFIHQYNLHNGILEGKLFTSFNLTEDKVNNIATILSKKEKKKVVLSQINDPHILGGVRIYLDNKIYDFSIEKKINDIKESLIRE